MITLPIWTFILCLVGSVVGAGIIAAAAMLLYVGKGLFG